MQESLTITAAHKGISECYRRWQMDFMNAVLQINKECDISK